ncbi:diguanylate cyclase [Gilvimarinus sp. SDUM040013]|uniref:diguanylate cyclase n=1 Tax=Gilvimarinus gilvus TaxID=3058038 RepID=A0ABU4S4Z5_9GAMM|nr:sensor domain-containing diguanylate cyclase [Gilvimarinus sp. SDUM040013]MDO3386138.1 diguanylate cyclase [Gilvimarinus sp. SDUM040013]MDX6851471.1 diguanylate cyclase [Gilvimarinus sp. SDUM040013]
MLVGGWASHLLVERFAASELTRQQNTVKRQANIFAQLAEKELLAADKLAVALSQDTAIINHQRTMNEYASRFADMTFGERKAFLEANPTAASANDLVTRLLQNLDLMSLFVLDASGNCIATAYTQIDGEAQPVGCLGENYQSREYFSQARLNGSGHQFAVGKRVPLPSLFFSYASYANGEFLGAAVVRLDAPNLLSQLPLSTTRTWITDRNGMVISSTTPSDVMQQLGARLYAPVSEAILEATYRLDQHRQVALVEDLHYPEDWDVWQLESERLFIASAPIGQLELTVWHSASIANFLQLYHRSGILALTVLVLGVLLILIVERVIDAHQRRMTHLRALADAHQSLEQVSSRLLNIAISDNLTQLSSRVYFFQRLEEEIARVHRESEQLVLLQLDIDNFKIINDTHGHPAGDEVIRTMAAICREQTRKADLLGRVGGEEFAIGLIECRINTAQTIAQNICDACANKAVEYEGKVLHFTCSIGLAELQPKQNIGELIRQADKALYVAKEAGRNCVRVSGVDTD